MWYHHATDGLIFTFGRFFFKLDLFMISGREKLSLAFLNKNVKSAPRSLDLSSCSCLRSSEPTPSCFRLLLEPVSTNDITRSGGMIDRGRCHIQWLRATRDGNMATRNQSIPRRTVSARVLT